MRLFYFLKVWMLARMCQLENKISAVGEPSYRLIAITSYFSVSSITDKIIFFFDDDLRDVLNFH